MEGTREEGRVGLGGGKGRRKGGQGCVSFGGREHGEETRVGEALVVGELEDGKVDCLEEPHKIMYSHGQEPGWLPTRPVTVTNSDQQVFVHPSWPGENSRLTSYLW